MEKDDKPVEETQPLLEVKPGLFLPADRINKHGHPKMDVRLFSLSEDQIQHSHQLFLQDHPLPQQHYDRVVEKASQNWDKFYRDHTTQFFKNRTYLDREIPEIEEIKEGVFTELGCGVGNAIFPLLEKYPHLKYYGCDFAQSAINLIKSKVHRQKLKDVTVEVVDLVKDAIPEGWARGDIVTLIFVLSAIAPQFHIGVLRKIWEWMKPGSILYFRDYGKYDFGQMNLTRKKNKKLQENFYVKNDGVCVYFFQVEELTKIFKEVGFEVVELKSHQKVLTNRKTGLEMYRIWHQGRLRKNL